MRRPWVMIVLLLLPAASSRAAQLQPAAGKDTVVIGATLEPATLNPLFARGSVLEWHVISVLFTLDVRRDLNWRLFANGVESIPSIRDGTWQVRSDRMTLAWTLKPRTWSDGRPVTCGDYVFTFNVARDDRLIALTAERRTTRRVANVVCPKGDSGREVAVTWNEVFAHANLGIPFVFGPVPRHVLERYYRANPGKFNEVAYGVDPRLTTTDGAYRLVEWRHGQTIVVESVGAHPIFGTPSIRRIIWRFIPGQMLKASLLSGEIDVISSVGLEFAGAVELEQQSGGRFNVVFAPGMTWEHFDFKLDNPFLRDVRVRRAIAHAINRTQLIQQLFGGRQPVSHTYLPPRHPGYTANVPRYAYDPARARALLQRAGFRAGSDGIMVDGEGQRFSLELSTTSTPMRRLAAESIREHLRQIGIEVTVVAFETRTFFSRLSLRNFTGLAMYAWIFDPSSDCDVIYTSDAIPSQGNNWYGLNFAGYSNADMDRICKALVREFDEAKRNELLRESARTFSRDLPALPLFFRATVAAAKTGLQNFSVPGIGDTFELWNAHQWYWK